MTTIEQARVQQDIRTGELSERVSPEGFKYSPVVHSRVAKKPKQADGQRYAQTESLSMDADQCYWFLFNLFGPSTAKSMMFIADSGDIANGPKFDSAWGRGRVSIAVDKSRPGENVYAMWTRGNSNAKDPKGK